jgi:hypothetical protein
MSVELSAMFLSLSLLLWCVSSKRPVTRYFFECGFVFFRLPVVASMDDGRTGTGFSMLTWTEGFLPSKSANQVRTNQSAIFVLCLSRGDGVGNRYPCELHWHCKQFLRDLGNVYFASERWGEIFVGCFLDRAKRSPIPGITRCKNCNSFCKHFWSPAYVD